MKIVKNVKLLCSSVFLIGITFISCSSGLTAKSSEIDSVSYAFGINIGESIKQSPVKGLDVNLIAKGIKDALENENIDSARAIAQRSENTLRNYFEKARNQALEKNAEMGRKFLEKNKTAEGVVELPSGLQYKILSAGTGPKPNATDKVKVHYKGSVLNAEGGEEGGNVFDSSYDRGEPIELQLDRVIKGWTEGLQLVNAGSKVKLYIPTELGYGRQPAGSIEPNSMLIFEIELIEVIPAEKEKEAETPAKKAEKKK